MLHCASYFKLSSWRLELWWYKHGLSCLICYPLLSQNTVPRSSNILASTHHRNHDSTIQLTVRTLEPWTPRLFSRFFGIYQSQCYFITRLQHFVCLLNQVGVKSEWTLCYIMADKSEVYHWLKSLSPGMKLERLSLQFESRGFRSRRSLAYVKSEDLDSFFPSPDKLLLAERRVL